jgi:hypothetical protein
MFASFGLKEIAAACVLSCVIAGGVAAMTAPSGMADPGAAISVDRSSKADRLSQPSFAAEQSGSTSSPQANPAETSRKIPFGCDAAFSPVAEPTRAHVYKRCMA